MTEEKAKGLIEADGFTVISLIGEKNGEYCFLCKDENGVEISVFVVNGSVIPSPI